MPMTRPRSGYTLPVFACAAAIAALRHLQTGESLATVPVNLLNPPEAAEIAIEQVAHLNPSQSLAITRSDPGDNLDLTRQTPVWALVEWKAPGEGGKEPVEIRGGEGVGKQQDRAGTAAIYAYAQKLLQENLQAWLQPHERITVTLILPEGRALAQRTSNAAFGVVEGLSLLGTMGISQPLSAPGQLQAYRQELALKAQKFDCLVFCVGENGLDLARQMGIDPERLVKTANWLGPMLVAAGLQGARSLLLFGYHGKLMKLAGGIFHTHHHLADGRLEILTAHCAQLGLPTEVLQQVFNCATAEAALQVLQAFDKTGETASQVYGSIAATLDRRAGDYILKHSERVVKVGSLLFDRDRAPIVRSASGCELLEELC